MDYGHFSSDMQVFLILNMYIVCIMYLTEIHLGTYFKAQGHLSQIQMFAFRLQLCFQLSE